RCVDCFHPRLLCKMCTLGAHRQNPFHCQEVWDGKQGFWQRESLGQLGLILDLGHRGQKCAVALAEARRMTFVHGHGIDEIRVRFCACVDGDLEGIPHALQLIAHGLWPGSWDKPQTVFTIELLKDFHLLSLQSQLSAQDFYRYLRRRTDNIQPDQVADRYRELLWAMQEFIWLRSVKRAGLAPCRHMAPASLAVLCPSCPQPGMNMDPGWRERPVSMRYLEALYTTIDGNFHQNQRVKPGDPNDFALTEGAAYFADVRDFASYQRHLGPLEREPSTCHKFGAMGYGGYGGRVSGTVGLSCARHMFVLPGGGVDLQKGERFANVDFAMISGLQRWMQIFLIISGYDINCQYRKNFNKRMQWFKDNYSTLNSIKHVRFPTTLAVIGKFHLPAHTASCRYKFSYYWMPGAAMTDGEAPERIWAVLNGLAARTREMSAGHRHDIINDHHSDMNVRRVHGMARSLRAKHEEALVQGEAIQEELGKLESKLPPERLAEWKRAEKVYLRDVVDLANHESLDNPYELKKESALSQKQIVAHLNQESSGSMRGLERRGLVGVLEEGIQLQELKLEISDELKEDQDAERVSDELSAKIERFHSRLQVWRELHGLFLRPLLTTAWAEWSASAPNEEDEQVVTIDDSSARPGATPAEELDALNALRIDLPSSYDPRIVHCDSMKEARDLERQLREGQANDALAELRVHLITKYSLKQQQQDVAGQVPKTRSRQHLKRKGEAIAFSAETYKRARTSMLTLMERPEECTYRELRPSDIVAFTMRDHELALGDSRKVSSWIWEDCSWLEETEDGALKNFLSDAIRVHWFRRSALKARWTEEKLLVEEEMRRTVRFFQHWRLEWTCRSERDMESGQAGRAAYGRKQASRYERLSKDAAHQFEGRIDIVRTSSILHSVH
ncbi:hypothetical protein OBBRIDRAFT_742414, partial [Obba rivulosa]